jgi:septum formation protein
VSGADGSDATPVRLILASASSARLRVLQNAGFSPSVVVSGVDEDIEASSTHARVLELAERKARVVAASASHALVLGCDSMLEAAGHSFGKPRTADEARTVWERHAGTAATLFTGHVLIDTASRTMVGEVAQTTVHFGRPSAHELAEYIRTGEPLRVAGGFTIDGFSAAFIEGIEGDPNNVLGLSIVSFRRLLHELGRSVTELWRTTPETR